MTEVLSTIKPYRSLKISQKSSAQQTKLTPHEFLGESIEYSIDRGNDCQSLLTSDQHGCSSIKRHQLKVLSVID